MIDGLQRGGPVRRIDLGPLPRLRSARQHAGEPPGDAGRSVLRYYGLAEPPFQMGPDSRFFFPSRMHRRAVFRLFHGLQQQEGFTVITGEIGAGKTMLVELLETHPNQADCHVVRILPTHLSTEDMLRLVGIGFGVTEAANRATLMDRIGHRLRAVRSSARRPLLIVDEAQGLSVADLDALWMLSRLSGDGRPLLQIVLLGQPALRETLARPELARLRPCIHTSCHLGPLSPDEVRPYVEHRLGTVGWIGLPYWEDEAFARIHQHAGGIPRRINRLCARVILHGALEEKIVIGAAMVDHVAGLDAELSLARSLPPGLARFAGDTARLDAFIALVMGNGPGTTVATPDSADAVSVPRRRSRMSSLLGVGALVATLGMLGVGWHGAGLAAVLGPNGLDPLGGTSLRGLLGDLLGGSTPDDKPLTLQSSLGVQSLLTDNVSQLRSPRRADLVTSLLPQVTLTGQSQRLQANINYAPSIQLYAETPRQDQVAQQFNGQALITAEPETLFLELHGYGTQQSSSGGLGQSALPYYSSQNRTNTIALEASPYVMHRFGGDGTLKAGYAFNYTAQNSSSAGSLANAQALFESPLPGQAPANGVTRSNREYVNFTTGENLGRFNAVTQLEDTRYSSSGNAVLAGAHQSLATTDFGYGINRAVALLGTVGYEDIAYSGLPPIRIKDAIWSGGARLTPNENSSVTVKYGHKDGFNSLTLNASYAVTARTRLFVSYSEGLTTSQQEIQDNLDNSTVDQFGNTISTATGAPTVIADQLLAPQNVLYRLRRASASAVSTYDRDVFSLTVEQENRALVTSGTGTPGLSDHGLSATFNWSRTITPDLTGTAALRYARTMTQAAAAQLTQAVGLMLQATYNLSPTLACTMQYFVTRQSSNQSGQSFLQNAAIIGIRKDL